MIAKLSRCLTVVFVSFTWIMPAPAQVILSGCTATVASDPQASRLVDISLSTGFASNPRMTGIQYLAGVAVQPSTGDLFGLTTQPSNVSPNSLVKLDSVTGIATVVGATGLPLIVEGDLAFNPVNGFLYGIADLGMSVTHRYFFRINPSNGLATIIGDLPAPGDYSAMAFRSDGLLYCIDDGPSGNSLLLTIDPNVGSVTSTNQLNIHLGTTVGMAFHPVSGIAYVADGGQNGTNNLYELDIGTNNLSLIGSTGVSSGLSGLTFISVPEPTSIVLSLTTILGIVCRRRNRKRST